MEIETIIRRKAKQQKTTETEIYVSVADEVKSKSRHYFFVVLFDSILTEKLIKYTNFITVNTFLYNPEHYC